MEGGGDDMTSQPESSSVVAPRFMTASRCGGDDAMGRATRRRSKRGDVETFGSVEWVSRPAAKAQVSQKLGAKVTQVSSPAYVWAKVSKS